MTINISFGWWLVPLAITLLSILWAVWVLDEEARQMGGIFYSGAIAIIVSLVAWLVWALL